MDIPTDEQAGNGPLLSVVIPTRNRPDKLRKCLNALGLAREELQFECYVCDSTQSVEVQDEVKNVVENFIFARYLHHSGNGVAAARNFCARAADSPLIVNVDDDVYVSPDAILRLYDRFMADNVQNVVIGGCVKFGAEFSSPVKMRRNGYGRSVFAGETPDFIIGAFFLYPKTLALRFPWNENLKTSDDRFMGALWRKHGVVLQFEKEARATHDEQLNSYDVTHQRSHIYANLFDAIFSRKSLYWFFCFEFLGFLAGAKTYFKRADQGKKYIEAWYLGHKDFIRDRKYLRFLVQEKRA